MKDKQTEINELRAELKKLQKKNKRIDDIEAEKKLYEKSLRFRTRLQKLITTISSKFISIQPSEIDFWIERTLRTLAMFSEADRASVFQIYDESTMMDNTHEWVRKGTPSVRNEMSQIKVTNYTFLFEKMSKHKEIVLFSINQLPENLKNEIELLNKFEIKSLLLVPLAVRGMLIGYIGLSTHKKEVIWTSEIMMLLKIAGEIIVNALVRKRAEDRLKQYHLIVTSASEMMSIIDRHYIFRSVNTAYIKSFQISEQEMVGNLVEEIYDFDTFIDNIKPSLDKSFRGEESRLKMWYTFPGTGKIFADIIHAPIYDTDNNIIGAVETIRNITKQKLAEEALIKAKERAERSDKLKTEFLAQISHEIRTPINSMISFASMLQEETANVVDDEVHQSFKIIGKAGRRIIRTTDLMVDMAELQAGTYEYEFEELDIYNDIIEEVYYDFVAFAKEKSLDYYVGDYIENIKIKADKYSSKQVLRNIIHNALTFTNKGEVSIILEKTPDNCLTVKIQDTGIGISKEYFKRIFEPFTQEDEGFTRRYEGSGLGLSLAKKYAELNNIKLEIESEKNKGTTVSLVFKLI